MSTMAIDKGIKGLRPVSCVSVYCSGQKRGLAAPFSHQTKCG